jgi:hypothetical protein
MYGAGLAWEGFLCRGTLEEAQWQNFGANKTHRLGRSTADKQRAVQEALKHPLEVHKINRSIAEHIGMDETMVRK